MPRNRRFAPAPDHRLEPRLPLDGDAAGPAGDAPPSELQKFLTPPPPGSVAPDLPPREGVPTVEQSLGLAPPDYTPAQLRAILGVGPGDPAAPAPAEDPAAPADPLCEDDPALIDLGGLGTPPGFDPASGLQGAGNTPTLDF